MQSTALRHAPSMRSTSYEAERELGAEIRRLSSLVGELTVMLVVQGAYLSALRARRAVPTAADVDSALENVSGHVPSNIADDLWSAREALIERFAPQGTDGA